MPKEAMSVKLGLFARDIATLATAVPGGQPTASVAIFACISLIDQSQEARLRLAGDNNLDRRRLDTRSDYPARPRVR